jgi:UDP-glucose-4-epimerase GalE
VSHGSGSQAGAPGSILVTGGSGYIGSHVVRRLHPAFQVLVVDRQPIPEPIRGICDFQQGEVGDRALLGRLLAENQVAGVIHLAGLKSVAESLEVPERYFENNVHGSLNLLGAMADAGVSTFIFSSSAAVYGVPTSLPVTEDAPTRPENPYGESKLLVERMLPWFERAHGIRSVSLRYFNAAGASFDGSIGENWSQAANLIPLVMRAALGESPEIEVYGTDYPTPDGSAIRDYIHVVDLAEAHVLALRHLLDGGDSVIANLGTGAGASVLEVIGAVERIGQTVVPVRLGPRRAGDPPAVWADNARAEKLLNWRPRHGLEEIVSTAWRWHAGRAPHPRAEAG